ncbi:MAG: hypothetical protein HZB29_03790 [Nitrospinae bacterium]|nr:hypothetical protein [Nitrospinota bacterium]
MAADENVEERLAKKNIGIIVTPAAAAYLAQAGYDETFGVRPLKRLSRPRYSTNSR